MDARLKHCVINVEIDVSIQEATWVKYQDLDLDGKLNRKVLLGGRKIQIESTFIKALIEKGVIKSANKTNFL